MKVNKTKKLAKSRRVKTHKQIGGSWIKYIKEIVHEILNFFRMFVGIKITTKEEDAIKKSVLGKVTPETKNLQEKVLEVVLNDIDLENAEKRLNFELENSKRVSREIEIENIIDSEFAITWNNICNNAFNKNSVYFYTNGNVNKLGKITKVLRDGNTITFYTKDPHEINGFKGVVSGLILDSEDVKGSNGNYHPKPGVVTDYETDYGIITKYGNNASIMNYTYDIDYTSLIISI
jgi:hypothetical protein